MFHANTLEIKTKESFFAVNLKNLWKMGEVSHIFTNFGDF